MKNSGFSASFLEELKQKNDIVSVASRYLTLDRKGKTYWARCPFHGEKTPSFAINEIDQYYHCFGCKASGDVIKFVQEMESVDFFEAVKILAEWAHLEVPELSNNGNEEDIKKRKQEKDQMLACMKEAAIFYRDQLAGQNALEAREYLKRRNIGENIIRRFGIGFSPDYKAIIPHLKSKGFSVDIQKKVGIVKEKDGRDYDALGERIIFPTINIFGDIIAFCGRTLKQKVDYAKYINTAETPIFTKGKNLYSINNIKKQKQERPIDEIIIVEGQIDAISLYKVGITNAVASMGTALTHDQAKLIKRFASKVVICYDGDSAGQSATMRGLEILKEEGLEVRIMSLPDGLDPDDYVNKYGAESYLRLAEKALPLIEYKLSCLKNKYNMEEIDGKARFTEETLEVLRGLSEIEANAYIDYIRTATGSPRDFLVRKLHKEKVDMSIDSANEGDKKVPIEMKETKHEAPFHDAEKCILACLLRKKLFAKFSIKLLDYLEGKYKEMYAYIFETKPTTQQFIEKFQENDSEIVGGIVNFVFVNDEELNKQLYEDCLWLVYRTYLGSLQGVITEKMKTEPEHRRELLKQYQEISRKIIEKKVEL